MPGTPNDARPTGTSPPARGGRLPLGWRLGLATAAIVTVVVGLVTFVQQRRELARTRVQMTDVLDESLGPLVASLERAGSIDEARGQIGRFLLDRPRWWPTTGLRIDLLDGDLDVVASSDPDAALLGLRPDTGPGMLHANLPVFSPVLGPGGGTLAVWKDDPSLEAEIARRWRGWAVEMALMIAAILASTLGANYVLVARPLHRLQEGVRHMGRGYLGVLKSVRGAPEWRDLAHDIWKLGRDLEGTVRALVEAERRALGLPCAGLPEPAAEPARDDPPAATPAPAGPEPGPDAALVRDYLRDMCMLLETQSPDDPLVQAHARGALERDVQLAERLGDIPLRSRLDDAAFRVLEPEAFERIARHFASTVDSPPQWLRRREVELREALAGDRVQVVDLQRRTKHLAGIWRKSRELDIDPEQVQDVFGFRVIVPDTAACYRALEALHRRFEPELLSFKDYVARPKPNGYRSLHTHLRAADGTLFEVQIRSAEMHREAEAGDGEAAHWRYKLAGRRAPAADRPPAAADR